MIRLSKTSKMPRKCKSWSTEAIDTCPGSIESRIKDVVVLVDACKGCYATTGMYNMPNVKAPRIHNKQDWKRKDWEDDMVEALRDDELFRWFDSGDCHDLRSAMKIKNIIMRTPKTKHWFSTMQLKFPKFTQVLTALAKLSNTVVR